MSSCLTGIRKPENSTNRKQAAPRIDSGSIFLDPQNIKFKVPKVN